MPLNFNILPTGQYQEQRYEIIKWAEESGLVRLPPYVDSKLIPTIGVGINLQVLPNLDAVLDAFGFTTDKRAIPALRTIYNSIRARTARTGGTDASLQNDLNGFMADANRIDRAVRADFNFNSETEIRSVFTAISPRYEADLAARIPGLPIAAVERLTLFSLAYNNANLLIGPGLVRAMEQRDRNQRGQARLIKGARLD